MLEQRIQQHFIDSADLKYQAAQVLSHPIAAAVQAVLACVTSGGKVLACGNGPSAAEAQQFAAFCVAGFERERPELAALALTSDSTLLTAATGGTHDAAQLFARQVRALGQAGDVLLALSVDRKKEDAVPYLQKRGYTFPAAWVTPGFQAALPPWLGWIAVVLLSLYLAVYPMIAAGLACLSDEERDLGVALVEPRAGRLGHAVVVGLSALRGHPVPPRRIHQGEGPGAVVHLAIGSEDILIRITRRACAGSRSGCRARSRSGPGGCRRCPEFARHCLGAKSRTRAQHTRRPFVAHHHLGAGCDFCWLWQT